MKSDRKLQVAVFLLLLLVAWLLVLTIKKDSETETIKQRLNDLLTVKTDSPKVINGTTPILGVDYFNGKNATDEQVERAVNKYIAANPPKNGTDGLGVAGPSAYDLAVLNGFTGTVEQWLESLKVKGDKGDLAPALDIDCQDGRIVKRYVNAFFWEVTKIKCEVENE